MGTAGQGGRLRGAAVDRATQRWVIATGRDVTFAAMPWLDGPVGDPAGIGTAWIDQHAARLGARLVEGGGLLPDLAVLDGPGFRAADLHPSVRSFYEATSSWELDVWSRWARWAEPGGRLVDAVFARRLRQLSLPLDPLDTAEGMDSRVVELRVGGAHAGTAWQRTLRATGATVFGGCYGAVRLPGSGRPSVRVVFPLPNGNLTVLLHPQHRPGGALALVSPTGAFGGDGAYLVVRPEVGGRPAATGWARRVPVPEVFVVDVDERGELRCDHRLHLGRAEVLRLRYRMRPLAAA